MNTSLVVFVVLIVLIGCATSLISEYMKMKKKQIEQSANIDDYESQISALEERVRVLERIVTEKKYDLKREISEL